MLLSSLYGKKVLFAATAEHIGTVKGVVTDNCTYEPRFIYTDRHMFIPYRYVTRGKDILLSAHIGEKAYAEECLIFCPEAEIYSSKGRFIGKLKDLSLQSKRKTLITDKGNISLKRVGGASGDFIILLPHLKSGDPLPEGSERVTVEAVDPPTAAEAEEPVIGAAFSAKEEPVTQIEPAISGDYGYLIGKHTTKEVSDIGRSFVVMAGTLITEKLIQNARKAGKLAEIASKSGE